MIYEIYYTNVLLKFKYVIYYTNVVLKMGLVTALSSIQRTEGYF